MFRYYRAAVFFVFLLCTLGASAQDSDLDSLIKALPSMAADSNKVKVLNDISWQLLSLSRYEEAEKYARESRSLAQKVNFPFGEVRALTRIGLSYYDRG